MVEWRKWIFSINANSIDHKMYPLRNDHMNRTWRVNSGDC